MGDHIGDHVRRVRLWRGLTQQELADLAGWTRSAVTMLETGARGLDSRTRLRQLAEALRVDPTDLTGEPYPLDAPSLADVQAGVPALERALMDNRIGDSPGVEPRPFDEIAAEVHGPLLAARLAADGPTLDAMLPQLLAELHAFGKDEHALRLLVEVCSTTSHRLRFVGQVPHAFIAAERAGEAAQLVGDPILIAAAEYTRAHSRPSAGRALDRAAAVADQMPGDLVASDTWAQEVYGMLRLTAALAAQVRGDTAEATAQADEAARVAVTHTDCSESWEAFGRANVEVWRTTLAVEAGDPDRALKHAAAVDMAALAWRSRQAALWVEVARAHHQGEPERGRELARMDEARAPQWSQLRVSRNSGH